MLETLTVVSTAGTEAGNAAITVTPEKEEGNLYKVKVADTAAEVTYGQNVKTWSAWDGSSEITAESGKIITVVECDSEYKAVKAGSATVASAE